MGNFHRDERRFAWVDLEIEVSCEDFDEGSYIPKAGHGVGGRRRGRRPDTSKIGFVSMQNGAVHLEAEDGRRPQ